MIKKDRRVKWNKPRKQIQFPVLTCIQVKQGKKLSEDSESRVLELEKQVIYWQIRT